MLALVAFISLPTFFSEVSRKSIRAFFTKKNSFRVRLIV